MMKNVFKKCSIFCIFMLIFLSKSVYAREIVYVNINSSIYVDFGEPIKRITSGNPSIAIIKQVDDDLNTGFLVEGHQAGTISILVWNMENQVREYVIVVSPEDVGISSLIQREIGLPNVKVKKIGDRILLTGTVKNQYEKNRALQIAGLYANGLDVSNLSSSGSGTSSGNIVDLLQMLNPTQIRLEAQVIDINSSDSKNLGMQWGYGQTDESGGITINPGLAYVGESIGGGSSKFLTNPFGWLEQHRSVFNASLRALVEKGKARILSRPNIMTMSGEEATIQIGGEIPYTTSNLSGTTVSFRNYGIILQFKPVVDADDRITISVHAESSNMSGQTVDGQPILATRRADSVVRLDSGATMIIGGLMDSSDSKNLSKIPLLGDIPIIGEFFKYHSKSKTKRELLILITPTIVSDPETDVVQMSEEMEKTYQESTRATYQESTDSPPIALDEGDLESGRRS